MRATRKIPTAPGRPVDSDRADTWQNVTTGFGVLGRDKRLGNSIVTCKVSQEEAEELWAGDDIAARIVETPPDDMLREGYEICVSGDREHGEALETRAEELRLNEHLREALQYERAYGGAGIVLGIQGDNLEMPLVRPRTLDWLTTYTPRELLPLRYYADPTKKNYGHVSHYQINPLFSPPGALGPLTRTVHESRVIRFGGNTTSRRAMFRNLIPGWGDSMFSRIAQVIADFQNNWAGASILMQDFAPAVLKMKGLAKILASQAKNDTSLQTRAQAIAMGRSIANTTILDAEEEFERKTVSVSGLAEVLSQFNLRLSAAAEMPVAMIMGDSPAGLNATGDSDHRWYYNRIKAKQKTHLRPRLKKIISLIMQADGKEAEKWDVEFNPLWLLTELEAATMRKTQAETDQIYITAQVVTPHEIAQSRFGDGYSSKTVIDLELRDEMANADDEKARLGEGAAGDKETERKAAELAAKPVPKPAAK